MPFLAHPAHLHSHSRILLFSGSQEKARVTAEKARAVERARVMGRARARVARVRAARARAARAAREPRAAPRSSWSPTATRASTLPVARRMCW